MENPKFLHRPRNPEEYMEMYSLGARQRKLIKDPSSEEASHVLKTTLKGLRERLLDPNDKGLNMINAINIKEIFEYYMGREVSRAFISAQHLLRNGIFLHELALINLSKDDIPAFRFIWDIGEPISEIADMVLLGDEKLNDENQMEKDINNQANDSDLAEVDMISIISLKAKLGSMLREDNSGYSIVKLRASALQDPKNAYEGAYPAYTAAGASLAVDLYKDAYLTLKPFNPK